MNPNLVTPPLDVSLPVNSKIRKRVRNACDRCRLKKLKKFHAVGVKQTTLCVVGPRQKVRERAYPKGYVEMLEQQHGQFTVGLQELYRRIKDTDLWPGCPLKESSNGKPLTHDILERLGALTPDEYSSAVTSEEDTNSTQQRLIASGVGSIQRQDSLDCESGSAHSSIVEGILSQSPILRDQFAAYQFPPTTQNHGSYPRVSQTAIQIENEIYIQPAPMQSGRSWTEQTFDFDDDMDFVRMSAQLNQQIMPMNEANLCLAIPDWYEDNDFNDFRFYERKSTIFITPTTAWEVNEEEWQADCDLNSDDVTTDEEEEEGNACASGGGRVIAAGSLEDELVQGLLRFAKWAFGAEGLPDLQVLAWGDFSYEGRYSRHNLLLRKAENGYRTLTKADDTRWDLVHDNMDMLSAYAIDPIMYD